MKRAPRSGRRTWTYVDVRRAYSCVIWGKTLPSRKWAPWAVERGVSAFDATCYLKLPVIGERRDRNGELTHEAARGHAVARLLTGDLVYAFYSHQSKLVKIGRTTDLRRRWTKLEHESGQLRQLVSVWRCPDSRELEHELHQHWLAFRTFGEWFAAAPVLADLQQRYRCIDSGATYALTAPSKP